MKTSTPPVDKIREILLQSADDDKANDISILQLPEDAGMGSIMIVLSATSSRHGITIAEHMLRALKNEKVKGTRVAGMDTGDWIVIDVGAVIVHIFKPEVRAYYDIESLWQQQGSKIWHKA